MFVLFATACYGLVLAEKPAPSDRQAPETDVVCSLPGDSPSVKEYSLNFRSVRCS